MSEINQHKLRSSCVTKENYFQKICSNANEMTRLMLIKNKSITPIPPLQVARAVQMLWLGDEEARPHEGTRLHFYLTLEEFLLTALDT